MRNGKKLPPPAGAHGRQGGVATAQIGHPGVRIGGGASGIELNRLDAPGRHRPMDFFRRGVVRQIQGHQGLKTGPLGQGRQNALTIGQGLFHRGHRGLQVGHVNVTSYNRKALITGEVPSAEIKDKVGQIAAEVPNVTGVHNEVQVAGISSFSARSSDTLITSKVKARFVDGKRFSANWVKVTTEAGVVYLMGLVTQQEADDAIELARTTSGVTKVVNLMEIISYSQAKELGTRSNDNPGVPSPNNTAR